MMDDLDIRVKIGTLRTVTPGKGAKIGKGLTTWSIYGNIHTKHPGSIWFLIQKRPGSWVWTCRAMNNSWEI
jgi:hypothetical protein